QGHCTRDGRMALVKHNELRRRALVYCRVRGLACTELLAGGVGQQRQVNCIKPGLRKKRSFSFQPLYYTLLFDYYRIMEMKEAVRALAAIGHESRLIVYRLLVQAGP